MLLKNPKHELFAQELASGTNASQAYRNAGFSDSRANACRLQQDERIRQRVGELLEERRKQHAKASAKAVEKLGLDRQWVLSKLVENVERGLQARAVLDDEGKPIGEYRYDGGVVNRALELLGVEQGMFIKRTETGQPGEFAAAQSEHDVLTMIRAQLGDEMADAITQALAKQADTPADGTVEPGPAIGLDLERDSDATLN